MINKNNIFWILIMASILSFYFITKYKINSLVNENNSLEDSLRTLQNELKSLDSLLFEFTIPQSNGINTSFKDTIIQEQETTIKVRFIPETKDADRYVWNFDDGTTSQDKEPMHIFNTNNKTEFNIKFEIQKTGVKDSFTKLIKFSNSENLDSKFDTTTILKRSFYIRVKFVPITRNADSYEWDFGDAQSSKLKEPIHEYDLNKSREYQVKCTLKKNDKSSQTTKLIQFPVLQSIDANFHWKIIDSNTNKVKFIPNTLDAETYEWSFGDNIKSNEKEPEHNYNSKNNNQFTASLRITKAGMTNQYTHNIVFKKADTVSIFIKLPKNIFYTNDKNNYLFELRPSGGIVSGKGVTLIKNQYYFKPILVEKPGNYKIAYEVNGKKALMDVIINLPRLVTFSLSQNEFYICDNNSYNFNIDPKGGIVKGPGVIQNNSAFYFKPSAAQTKNGIVTFSYNLQDTTVNYSVKLNDISPSFITDSTSDGRTILFQFNAAEINADDYIWTVNGNEVTHKSSYNVSFRKNTNYDFRIKLTVKKKGCVKTSIEKHYQYYYIG